MRHQSTGKITEKIETAHDLPGQIWSSVNVTLGRHEGGQHHAPKTVHT
jgi:hypothetical protein